MSFVEFNELEEIDFNDNQLIKTGVSGYEVAYSSTSKAPMKKSKRHHQVRRKLEDFQDKRRIEREFNSLYDDWD